MKNARCLVISGGHLHDPEFYQARIGVVDFVIAADAGARHARALGLRPHLVLGDFDTLTPQELAELKQEGIPVEQYPPAKDFTDTHLALLKAVELGYTDIVIIAALGGRLDHTLANIMLLALPEAGKVSLKILDEEQEILLIKDEIIIRGEPGQIVSLLPLSEKVSGIATSGLEYQVPGGTFVMGIPNGISNVMTAKEARIKVAAGLLLAIIPTRER